MVRPSPPPAWNFTRIPDIHRTDAYWQHEDGAGHRGSASGPTDMHLPRNSPVGIFLAFFAVILGFALIWRIDWLAGIGLIGALAVILRGLED